MKRRRRKFAKLRGDRFGSNEGSVGKRTAGELHGELRSTSNSSGAAPAQESRFKDAPIFYTCRKFQDVTANGIADLHDCSRARKFTSVARIPEMFKDGFAKHDAKYRCKKYRNAAAKLQCKP